MVKNSRQNKTGRKFSHNSSILSTGDQELPYEKTKYPNRTPVYVHDYKTNHIRDTNIISHSNVYTHGFQDYISGKAKFLKSKFDSLTLVNKNSRNSTNNPRELKNPSRHSNRTTSSYQKNKPIARNPEPIDECVINQLEESYWANWKPSKSKSSKPLRKSLEVINSERLQPSYQVNIYKPIPSLIYKAKPIREEELIQHLEKSEIELKKEITNEIEVIKSEMSINRNEKRVTTIEEESDDPEKSLKFLHNPTIDVIDSNYSDTEFNSLLADTKTKLSNASICSKMKEINLEDDIVKNNEDESIDVAGSSKSIKKDLYQYNDMLNTAIQPHLMPSESGNNEPEEIHTLKHTDSFIINAKKQGMEKPYYPQPKCIKLQKNPAVINRSHNYIKGGSYPLKSCLKKDKLSSQSLVLGKPGSPILLQPNKNKKTRKYK